MMGAVVKYSSFLTYIFFSLLTNIGTWIHVTIEGWLLKDISSNPATALGILGLASSLPAFIVQPLGGIYADKWNNRTILLWCNILNFFVALSLSFLVAKDLVTSSHLIIAALVLSASNFFAVPALLARISAYCGDLNLSSAVSFVSAQFYFARIGGPILAVIIISSISYEAGFAVNSLSYLFFIGFLVSSKGRGFSTEGTKISVKLMLYDLKNIVFSVDGLKFYLVIVIIIGVFVMPVQYFFPMFADNAEEYRNLLAFYGAGAALSALITGVLLNYFSSQYIFYFSFVTASIGLLLFGLSNSASILYLAAVLIGSCQVAIASIVMGEAQTLISSEMKGRILALIGSLFYGGTAIGSLVYGTLEEVLRLEFMFICFAVCLLICFFSANAFWGRGYNK